MDYIYYKIIRIGYICIYIYIYIYTFIFQYDRVSICSATHTAVQLSRQTNDNDAIFYI